MKIEDGKRYLTRDGKIAGPVVVKQILCHPVIGAVDGEPFGRSWHADGQYVPLRGEHRSDLVAEVR